MKHKLAKWLVAMSHTPGYMPAVDRQKFSDAGVELERLSAEGTIIRAVVDEQAKDEGLWCHADNCFEAYLQAALRRLHEIIEGKTGDEIARDVVSGSQELCGCEVGDCEGAPNCQIMAGKDPLDTDDSRLTESDQK